VVRFERLGHQLAEGRGPAIVTIENNTIIDPPGAGIYVGAAREVRILSNSVTARLDSQVHRAREAGIVLENCAGVLIDGFRMRDPRPTTAAAVEIAASVEPGERGVQVRNLKAELAPGSRPVLDARPAGGKEETRK
jgi:hypothetical protein